MELKCADDTIGGIQINGLRTILGTWKHTCPNALGKKAPDTVFPKLASKPDHLTASNGLRLRLNTI